MTATTTQTQTDIRRCAFCKIDRKGRFILADQKAEKLFGLSEVELFSRPFVDFLDPADHELFSRMTENRNPYETVFDAVDVDVLDRNGQRTPVTLIVSVNFGGGNPANYQVLVCPRTVEETDGAVTADQTWADFVDLLSSSEGIDDAEALGGALQRLVKGATVTMYVTESDRNTVLYMGGPGIEASSESNADKDARVPAVPDIEGGSPDDIRATFALADSRVGLVILSLDLTDPDSNDNRRRAELAALTLHSFCPPLVDGGDDHPDHPLETVGQALDRLDMGWVDVDAGGNIRQYNTTFETLFDSPANLFTVRDLIDIIATRAGFECAATVRAYLEASSDYPAAPRLQLCFRDRSKSPIALTFYRAQPGTEDLSGCFLFSRVDVSRSANPTAGLSTELSTSAITILRSSITAARSVSQKLEHEHHNELGRDGGFDLKCLGHHLSNLDGLAVTLNRTLELISDPERPQRVDLGLLVEKTVTDLAGSGPYNDISLKCSGLPKIRACRRRLAAILYDVFRTSLERIETGTPEIRVTAEVASGDCVIRIEDNGPRLTKKQSRRLFDLASCLSQIQVGPRTDSITGLALAQEILRPMGGRIELEISRNEGCVILITIPES